MIENLFILFLLGFFCILGYLKKEYLIGLILLFLPSYVIRFDFSGLPLIGTLPTTLLELMLYGLLLGLALHFLQQTTTGKRSCSLKKIPFLINHFRSDPLDLLPLAFLANATFAALISPDRLAAFGIWKAYFIEPVLFYYVLRETLKQSILTKKIVLFSLAGSLLWLGLIGVGQYVFDFNLHVGFDETGRGRVLGVFNTPNAVGLYLAPLLAFFLPHLVSSIKLVSIRLKSKVDRRDQNIAIKNNIIEIRLSALILAAVFVSGLALYFSFSRGAWLGLLAALVVFAIIKIGKKSIIPLFVSLALCIVALFLFIPRFHDFFSATGNPADLFGDNSANVRVNIYKRTVKMLEDRPILGAGLAGFQHYYSFYDVPVHEEIPLYPHNIILNFWSETGALGLVLFSLVLLKSILLARKTYKYSSKNSDPSALLSFGILLFLVALNVHGLVDVPYFKNDLSLLFWTMLALIPAQTSKDKT